METPSKMDYGGQKHYMKRQIAIKLQGIHNTILNQIKVDLSYIEDTKEVCDCITEAQKQLLEAMKLLDKAPNMTD